MIHERVITTESRILLVDDDPGTIRVLVQVLRDLGRIHFTTQGSEAMALALSVVPDLVLLDMEMPDRHGLVVCEEIKNEPTLADVPVLFVTSHTDRDLEVRALQAGAIDFIAKPPHPEVVRARVSNYLALKHQTTQLRMLTMLDGLTGISNRRAFDKAIRNEWRRACRDGHPLSLLMLDVDHFKRYNDSHGHQAGDDCLRAVAACLATKVRRSGDMAARYGGEEFVCLLPNCSLGHAMALAEQIRREVAELRSAHPEAIPAEVRVSIGVAERSLLCQQAVATAPGRTRDDCPRNACRLDPTQLIELADHALYLAKQGGRNRVETVGVVPAPSDPWPQAESPPDQARS